MLAEDPPPIGRHLIGAIGELPPNGSYGVVGGRGPGSGRADAGTPHMIPRLQHAIAVVESARGLRLAKPLVMLGAAFTQNPAAGSRGCQRTRRRPFSG